MCRNIGITFSSWTCMCTTLSLGKQVKQRQRKRERGERQTEREKKRERRGERGGERETERDTCQHNTATIRMEPDEQPCDVG